MKCFFLWLGLTATLLLTRCYGGSRPSGIGLPAPDFIIQDADRKITLNQFRGQVVILNFWASYCPPCLAETPSLISMQERLRTRGVTVVAVSIDDDEQAYHRFIQAYGINFITVRDPSQRIEHLYGTSQIPDSYIIDRHGLLRRKFVNSVDWNSPEVVEFLKGL